MRRAFVLLLSVGLLLAGCGGDDSKDSKAPSPTTSQPPATGPTAATGPRAKQPSSKGNKPSTVKKRTTPTKPSQKTGGFAGQQGDAYVSAEASCRKTALRTLAVFYQINSTRPKVVARAYTQRAYRAPLRRAAYEGCLAGLRKKSK